MSTFTFGEVTITRESVMAKDKPIALIEKAG